MIDCSKTENYFAEKQRMTGQRKDGICELNCIDCPLSRTSISNYEYGKFEPDIKTIIDISDLFNVTIDELLK